MQTYISVKYKTLYINTDNTYWKDVNSMQTVYGAYPLIGFQAVITDNGVSVYDVTEKPYFTFDYQVQTEGYHVLKLVVYTSNGTQEIANTSFNVISGIAGNKQFLFPKLSQPLGSIIGMIITLFCLLIPFMIARGLHMKQQLHPVIYAFSGGMGIAISVILGLFPTWLPFFLVAIGIIVIVLAYLIQKRGGNE